MKQVQQSQNVFELLESLKMKSATSAAVEHTITSNSDDCGGGGSSYSGGAGASAGGKRAPEAENSVTARATATTINSNTDARKPIYSDVFTGLFDTRKTVTTTVRTDGAGTEGGANEVHGGSVAAEPPIYERFLEKLVGQLTVRDNVFYSLNIRLCILIHF